jgi:LysM repeat protein
MILGGVKMADDEQTNPENDPGIEETTETNPTAQEQQPAVSHEQRNQWILFGILVGILLGVVLVIAVLRPLIFNRIVPAVMGDFVTPVPAVVDEVAPEATQPAEETTPAAENAAPVEAETGSNEIFIPAASGGGGGDSEVMAEETAVSPIPVSEPAPAPVTHTVQVGDNLTKISAQYGVPVADIMAANNLTNADYISVGQVLVIPTN